jgi:hypothetical protein
MTLDDPDAWRSRKTVDLSTPLRDIAHPERSIREFRAKVLVHKLPETEEQRKFKIIAIGRHPQNGKNTFP